MESRRQKLKLFLLALVSSAATNSFGATQTGCSQGLFDFKTLVGGQARVAYIPGKSLSLEQPRRITIGGVVVRDFPAGADVLVPSTGEVHQIHTSRVKVESFLYGRPTCSWTKTVNDVSGLKEILNATQPAFGIVYIADHNAEYSFAGEISWVKDGYNELVVVRDTNGHTRTIDPRHFFLEFYITDGQKVDKSVYAKYPNSKDPGYDFFDATFNSRMAMVSELTKRGKYFKDSMLYEYLEEHLTESLWMIRRSYPRSWQIIETVETLVGKKYAVLLADPGIATRAGDFADFAKTYVKKHPNISAADLREAFSNHLGTQTIYYASFFDSEELAAIPTRGVTAGPLRADENTARLALSGVLEPYKTYTRQPWAKYLGEDLFAHRIQAQSPNLIDFGEQRSRPFPLTINPENWLTLHSSYYPQVAAALGYYGPNGIDYGDNANKTFALVEAEVPVISIVKATGPFFDFKHAASDVQMQFPQRIFSLQNNPNAEVFIPFSIPPSAIRSVKPFDSAPPKPDLVIVP